ncbi:major histocompatibility complex class I-related gene protein-like [Cololabis saira]|uniref:major histocompatibility complex class I-related gene protein-like n=1 Tax=Cololabis saira TaxID=129043 RepID=UPI002AD24E62|nr:major histocompatibility complex class I-related gene protein-like [Cololabis saira]
MIGLLFLLLSGIDPTVGVTHSLKYFLTGSSGITNFPEFVAVGLVDDVQMVHYDGNTRKAEPKQDWMSRIDDPQWQRETVGFEDTQKKFKDSLESLQQRFNQTGGVHILQNMYGCEWDDETGDVKGYYQFGYDGEDFIALDPEKMDSWIAANQEAFKTKMKWDHDRDSTLYKKKYLTQICPEWVKKYVNYGRSSLMRTEHPSVSLLQKTSSSPVSCHATGFYPNRTKMFWRKDGEEIHEGVDKGEILPNNDGTFQMTVDLRLPSNSSEDWTKYECLFQLSGDNDDIAKLDPGLIRSNEQKNYEPKPNNMNLPFVVTLVLVVLAAVIVIVVVGLRVTLYKKKVLPCKNDKRSLSIDSQDSNKKMLPNDEQKPETVHLCFEEETASVCSPLKM